MKTCPDCQTYKAALEFCAREDLFDKNPSGSRGRYTMRDWFGDVAKRALEIVAVRNRKTETPVPAYAATTPPLDPALVGAQWCVAADMPQAVYYKDVKELLFHIDAVEAERDNALGYNEKMHKRAVIAENERDTLKSELERVKRERDELRKKDCHHFFEEICPTTGDQECKFCGENRL